MKKAARGLLIAVATVMLCLVLLYLGVRQLLDPPMRGSKVASRDVPEATESTIVVPVFLPIQTLEDWANEEAPPVYTGSRRWRKTALVELWDITGVLRVQRGSIAFAENQGSLAITTPFTGTLRFTNVELLYRSRPDFDVVDIEGRMHGAANLTITPDWRIRPELEARIHLNDASVFGIISIRDDLAPTLQEELDRELEYLEHEMANDDSLERAARRLWGELCGTTLIREDPELFLETIPTGLRLTQPGVVDRNLQLEVGLVARTRITEVETTPTCVFPRRAVVDDAESRGSSVHLPVTLRYETLGEMLADGLVGRYFGDSIAVTTRRVVLHPGDEEPVLELELHIRNESWLAPGAEGIVHVVARPGFDPGRQALELHSLQIATRSGNAVVAAFGDALVWRALDFTKPPGDCSAEPGDWARPAVRKGAGP